MDSVRKIMWIHILLIKGYILHFLKSSIGLILFYSLDYDTPGFSFLQPKIRNKLAKSEQK